MKSPWKFLVELASGRRAPDKQEGADDPGPTKPEASPLAGAIEHGKTATNEPGGDFDANSTPAASVKVDGEQADPATPDDGPQWADDHVSLPADLPEQKPLKRRTAARKTSTRRIAAASPRKLPEGKPGDRAPTFLEEVTALDDEITQLKRRLAEKLSLQNTQLRKMLRRFDT